MTLTVASMTFDRINDLYNITMSDDTNKAFVNLNQLTQAEAQTYPPGSRFDVTITPAAAGLAARKKEA